jgi:aminopeptidase N
LPQKPVVSLNRGFSAPIQLTLNATPAEQIFQMAHDRDSFNRWEAGQTRSRALILEAVAGSPAPAGVAAYAGAVERVLKDSKVDQSFKALMLGLPGEAEIAAAIGRDVDPDAVAAARDGMRRALGQALSPTLMALWKDTAARGPYRPDPAGTARRSLRYAVLQLLMMADPETATGLAQAEIAVADSMTAEIGALTALIQVASPAREAALDGFLARHGADPLLVDKWLMLNAQCAGGDPAARIARLSAHPAFDWRTPNRVHALISAFAAGNIAGFNAADGEGYRVVADAVITLDGINPQVAARVATGFRSFRIFENRRRAAAQAALDRILAQPALSPDCFEIVSRIARA